MGHPADFRTFYIFCCRFGTDRTFRPKFCGHLREDVCYAGRSSAKVKMGQKCTSVAPVHTESTFFGKIGNVSFSLSGNRGYPKVVKKDSGGATLGHIEVPTWKNRVFRTSVRRTEKSHFLNLREKQPPEKVLSGKSEMFFSLCSATGDVRRRSRQPLERPLYDILNCSLWFCFVANTQK